MKEYCTLTLWHLRIQVWMVFICNLIPGMGEPGGLPSLGSQSWTRLKWLSSSSVSVQFKSVTQLCLTLWDLMDGSMPGFPVHQLQELAQTHVHWVGDAIKPYHPVIPFLPAFSLSHYQGLFQWVSCSHQVAKVLELHNQSFQRTFRTDFL